MTKPRDGSVIIRTKEEERKRDKEIFKLGFGAGVGRATKEMMRMTPSEQMNYRKNRRLETPSEEMLDDMLDYFDEKYS
ncbi:hypothetical protein ACW0FU_004130 [Vibrio vulnificus]|uniref:hypothetical protein n=1 Tax=Vibrio TaxID=662 RepID=UPI000C9E82F2|nr:MULTISPECIES: hypothetical protein [Vibrio]EGR2730634.1 hypothetical protein [Vibrio parahaemolyticus]EGR0050094.1 hypothetical protein [Vibrio vulnificus]EGR2885315.1 hypothetical protein [Vibrio parahaemolyticus]EGR2977646.1 hypothetical protein [Vibrio parahaemolyticus]EGR3008946.1 hypothetical protein [Vibrio parahaemolyticus]